MKDEILVDVGFIGIVLMTLLSVYLCYSYISLRHFKSCYDINFQDDKCIKYLNY